MNTYSFPPEYEFSESKQKYNLFYSTVLGITQAIGKCLLNKEYCNVVKVRRSGPDKEESSLEANLGYVSSLRPVRAT